MLKTPENKGFATTCPECGDRILTQYNTSHAAECEINKFLANNKKESLVRLELSDDLAQLLQTEHGLPISEFKFQIANGCGYIHVAYAPKWLHEGILMYQAMNFAGMELVDFLRSLG
jgi:hypothetical protein